MDRGPREGGGRQILIRSNDEAHSCRSPHGCTHGLHTVHSAARFLALWRPGTGAEAPTQIVDERAVTLRYPTGSVVVFADPGQPTIGFSVRDEDSCNPAGAEVPWRSSRKRSWSGRIPIET